MAGSAHSSSVTAATCPASCDRQQRGHGAVDPAAHRDEDTVLGGRDGGVGADGRPEGAVQRVGREVGGVQLAGAQPAQLGRDDPCADAGGVEDVGAVDELDRRGRRGLRGAAARRVEGGLRDAVPLHAEGDPDEVAAGGATRRPVVRAGRRRTTVARMAQVILEALVHAPSLGRASPMAKAVAFAWLSAVPRQIAIASGTRTRPMTARRIVQPGEVLSSSGMVSSASSGSAQYQSGEVIMPSAALQTVTAMLNVATVIGMSGGGPHEVAPGARDRSTTAFVVSHTPSRFQVRSGAAIGSPRT